MTINDISKNNCLLVGDDVSGLKIYEIINKYFGQQYTGWMKAWYDINDEYAAWFPTITETNDRPSGSYGGTQSYSNTLSDDGSTILEINHDAASSSDEDDGFSKRRFVFGRIKGKFKFLGIFERSRVVDAERLTFKHKRIAIGVNLDDFSLIKEGNERGKKVAEWFISGNPKEYNLFDAFHDLGKVDWKQTFTLDVGDIVYIYVSKGYGKVMFKCKVNKTDLDAPEIDDKKYDLSGKYDGTYGRYMEIEPIAEFDTDLFERVKMEKYGFSAPQGHLRVKETVKEYMDVVQFLLNTDEMEPDAHDGSYELARETVRAYKNMNNLASVDYRDLNLLYHMVIGTWKMSVEQKKKSIDKSNLPDNEKERLKTLLDTIWSRAENSEYKNREDKGPSIGMFGTGFYSFDSNDEGLAARTFLGLCIEILDMSDDDMIYDAAEKYFTQEILGLKTASASAMLHCLKPFTFPVLNTNFGSNTIYEYFGLDLKKMKMLTTYIPNCRTIKAFRDDHFKVKNYRIYDKAARLVNKAVSNTKIDYISVLDYLENNRGIPYSNPETETDPDKKDQLLNIKTMGQNVVAELKAMYELCKEKFNLDKCEPISWLDGSNTKTRQYLWVQMKYSAYAARPESISIFVDMSEVTERARYRFSLELKNDGSSKEVVENYHRHLDIPLPEDGTLLYVSGSNEFGRPEIINEDQETIKAKVRSGEYKKVQVCSIAEWNDDYSNDDYEQAMLKGVEALIPYYEHVIGVGEVAYWPSKAEYDPGLTSEKWIELLNDQSVTTENNLKMFAMMVDYGEPATCTQLAEKYGQTKNFFNAGSSALAKRVADKTGCPLPPDRINENARWWPILYVGRDASKEEKGSYVWKLRDELMDALEQIELPDIKENEKMSTDSKFGLNTILYGPPGTGKTYSTVKYAVSICDPEYAEAHNEYDDLLKRFNELKADGQVAFTTFHQSYGYEEFIEGIKPIMVSDSEAGDSKDVKYDVVPGVFKEFCTNASKKKVETKGFDIDEEASIWKVTIKSEVRQDCFDNDHVRINWEFNTDGARAFVNDMSVGDIILTTDGSRRRINGIAVVTSEEAYEFDSETDKTTRDVKWLAKNIDEDITDINAGKMIHRMTVARVPKMKVADVVALASEKNHDLSDTIIEDNTKPYVFIIDEINRGNISKIFGELITLIEETKRAGAVEAMEAILPYSGDPFSVPKNVYILGTMNTADRSIALMDTALRRRFDFEEMMPDADVLRKIGADKVEDLDVALMLEKINERITFLYDREHTIGHAFFTGLKEEPTVKKLASIFSKSVIPLLQEYFYEDYQKIQMVLGDNGKTDDDYKFIKDTDVVAKNIFKGNVEAVIDLPEKRYEINEAALYEIESYKEIL